MSAHGPWDEGGQAPILPVLGPASSGGAPQMDPEWEGEDDFFGQALEYEERLAQERAAAEAARAQQAAYEAHWRNTAVALLHAPVLRGKALSVQEFAVVTDAVAQALAQGGMVPINEEGDNCSEASWDASSISSGFPMMGPPTDGGAAPGSVSAAAGGAAARGTAPSLQAAAGGQAACHSRHRLAASSSDAVAGAAMAAAATAAVQAAGKPQGQQASGGSTSGGKKAGGAFEDSASAWRGRESATSSSDSYTFPNSPSAVRRQLFTDIVRYPKGVELPSKGRGAHTSHYDAGAAVAAADGTAPGAQEGDAPAAGGPVAGSAKPLEGKAQASTVETLPAGSAVKGAAAVAATANAERAPAAGHAGKQAAASGAPEQAPKGAVSRPKSAAASTRPPSTPAAPMARAPSAPVAAVRPVSAGAPATSYAALAGVQGPLQRPTSAGLTAGQRSKQEVAANRLNISIQSDRNVRVAAVSPTRVNATARPRSVSPGPPGLHEGCRIFARGGRAVSPGPPQRGAGAVSPGPQRGARAVSPGPPLRGPGTISPGPQRGAGTVSPGPQRGAALRPPSAGRRALGPGPELEEEIQRQLGRLHRVRQEHWETATRVGAPILRNVSPGRPTGAGDYSATMGGAAAAAEGSPGRVPRQTHAARPGEHEEQQWRLQQHRARQQQDFDFGESWRSFIERQQVFLEGRALKIQMQRQGWQEEISAPKMCPGSQRIIQRQQLQQQRRQQDAQPTTPSSRKPRTPTAAEATQDSTAAPSAATTEGGGPALLRRIDQQLRSPGSSRGGTTLSGDTDGESSGGGSTTPSYGIAATKAAARAASAIYAAASSPRGVAAAAPAVAPAAAEGGDTGTTTEARAGVAEADAAATPSFCVGSNPGNSPSCHEPTNPTSSAARPVSSRLRSLLRFGNKPRSIADMSEGDRLRRERRLAEARAAKEARELEGATFRPKLSAGTASGTYADVRPGLAQLRTDPEGYMAAVAEKQRRMEVKREWAAKEREAAELAECTFSPRTTRSSPSRSAACSSAGASEASWAAAYGAGTGGWARRRPSERAAAAPGKLTAGSVATAGDRACEAAAAAAAKSYVLESPQWEKVESELRAMQSRWHAAARQKSHAASGAGAAPQRA